MAGSSGRIPIPIPIPIPVVVVVVACFITCALVVEAQPAVTTKTTKQSLQISSGTAFSRAIVVVVSQKPGEGDFSSVQAAIDAVPANNQNLTLIRIKPGIYREKVTVPAEKPYIILSGASANSTVITYNDSARSSGGTFFSATVTVYASDFTARYVTIENSYGEGDQAVALHLTGDRAAMDACRIMGFQDTLLDDSGRHYFRNCFIQGAADFICGDGQSVYERCHLHAVPTLNGAIAAQRRSSPGDESGYIFLNCRISGGGLMFLGRAWGLYSRVVYAYCSIDDIVFPQGWDNWKDPSRESTVFFAQYKCSGAGANTSRRVKWAKQLSDAQAQPYLSNNFVQANSWLTALPSALVKPTRLVPYIH